METVFNYDVSNFTVLIVFGLVLLALSGVIRFICWRNDFELAGIAKYIMRYLPHLSLLLIIASSGMLGFGYLQYQGIIKTPPPTATPIPTSTPIPQPTVTVVVTFTPIPTQDTLGCIRWSDVTMDNVGYSDCIYGVVQGAYPAGGDGFVITFSSQTTDFYFVGYGDWAPQNLIGTCVMAYGEIQALGTTPLMVVQPFQVEECTFE